MTIKDLSEPEICGLQAIFPDIIKSAAPIPANTLKKLLTIINDEQELRRRIDERANFSDWVKSAAEQIRKEQPTDEIKVGDRVNTPQGEGKVVSATGGHIFVQLDNGDLWFNGIHESTKIEDNPTHEIKCGDIVRVKRETPRDLYNNLPYDMPFFVAEIERDCDNPMNDTFFLRNGKTCLNIHPHWLEKWDATKSKDNTITIPVKADFGEDVGFALLDKALELQKRYTELEGDIRRLCDWVMGLKNNENPIICARFSNPHLKCICDAICDFRPLTEEERKQRDAEFKIAIDNLKKQEQC